MNGRARSTWILIPIWLMMSRIVAQSLAEAHQAGTQFVMAEALATKVPPEVGADALIRLAKLRQRSDSKSALELLQGAFRLANSASYAMQIRSLTTVVDSRSGRLEMTLRHGLDRVSLQSRVVDQLLLIGQVKLARELFEQIRLPALRPVQCEDAFTYAPGGFYVTLSSVVSQTLSAKEREQGYQQEFLSRYIRLTSSIAQVEAVADLVASQARKGSSQSLISALGGRIQELPADDRSFGSWKSSAIGSIAVLSRQLESSGISADLLRAAAQTYLVRQYKANHCIDSPDPKTYRSSVEEMMRALSRRADGSSIGANELPDLQEARSGSMNSEPLWANTRSIQMFQQFGAFSRGRGRGQSPSTSPALPLTENQRTLILNDIRTEADAWRPESATNPAVAYHEKAEILKMLINISADDREKLSASRNLLSFLSSSGVLMTHPLEWLGYLSDFINEVQRYPNTIRTPLLAEMAAHREPLIALTACLRSMEEGVGAR